MKKESKPAKATPTTVTLDVINFNAAGIDVGSKFHMVAVGQDKDKDVVKFGVTTPDLHEMAKFLSSRNIEAVAMESTGYYWIPLYWMLVSYDFKVIVVNPRDIKRINGPKTDVKDAQWIQKLHTAGFLKASFQLNNFGEGVRAYNRRRNSLVRDRTRLVNRMHKSLILMNVQIGTQLSELSSTSGLAVIRAIVGGETDPNKLLLLINKQVKTPKAELLKALHGTWQPHYIFELKQLYASFQSCNEQIHQCDEYIEKDLEMYCIANNITPPDASLKPQNKAESKIANDKDSTSLQVVRTIQSINGLDLLSIGGVGAGFILNLFAELGVDFDQFPTAKHFASWLGLAPQVKITGGKVISSSIPKRNNPVSQAFRSAANSIGNTKEHSLKPFFLSILKKSGRKGAIVATAHKLAIIYYHMMKDKTSFNYEKSAEQIKQQRIALVKKVQKIIVELDINPQEINFTV